MKFDFTQEAHEIFHLVFTAFIIPVNRIAFTLNVSQIGLLRGFFRSRLFALVFVLLKFLISNYFGDRNLIFEFYESFFVTKLSTPDRYQF